MLMFCDWRLWIIGIAFLGFKLQYLFYDGIPKFRKQRVPLNWFQRLVFHSVGSFALHWNDMTVHNAEVIDEVLDEGNSCLMLGYHSRCTTDILLVMSLLQPKLIVTHLFFAIPIVNVFFTMIGFLPSKTAKSGASEEEAFIEHLSQTENPLMLLPGGIFEALKTYDQRFKVQWKGCPGYARVIEKHIKNWKTKGLRVVPFYTKNSEDFYPTTITWHDYSRKKFYEYYEQSKKGNILVTPILITTLLFSLGCVISPRPVQLDTVCGSPITWEANDTAESFNGKVVAALQQLVDETNAKEFSSNRPSNKYRDPLHHLIFGVLIILQNILFAVVTLTLIWSTFIPLLILSLVRKGNEKKDGKKKHHDPTAVTMCIDEPNLVGSKNATSPVSDDKEKRH